MSKPEVSAPKLTQRQIQRRERILKVAQQLTGERGYDGASMRAIAAASHVAEKTLYNIFGSKDRLIAMAAQHRSADVFEAAAHSVPDGGMAFLLEFGRRVAEVTLEAPEMARVLAQVLLDHSDLVGLNDLYEHYVGLTFDQMSDAGLIEERASRASFIRLFRLGIVSAVILWSKGEVSDEDFAGHLELEVLRTLLPVMKPRISASMLVRAAEIARQL
jgi:AcrR family transcriptional regulator